MGTVNIQLSGTDTVRATIHTLMAMGKDRPPKSDSKNPHRNLSTNYGRTKFVTSFDGRYIYASWYPNLENLTLSFHLSHFRTASELERWLQGIFIQDLVRKVYSSRITRLDLCVDMSVPMQLIWRSVIVPKVSKSQTVEAGEVSLYFGKLPRQTYFYQKKIAAYLLDQVITTPVVTSDGLVHGVRCEVRLVRDRIPIGSLNDLHKLTTLNPFEHIKFMGAVPYAGVSAAHPQFYSCTGMMKHIEEIGLDAARKEYNKQHNNNFARDFKLLTKAPSLPNLYEAWKVRCDRFFEVHKKEEVKEGAVG